VKTYLQTALAARIEVDAGLANGERWPFDSFSGDRHLGRPNRRQDGPQTDDDDRGTEPAAAPRSPVNRVEVAAEEMDQAGNTPVDK
jgi:hypothetical protein